MAWWHENRHRMIQNNIRDIDVQMDIDKQIEWLKSFNCNVFMVNCGGITAFYPTRLQYHYRSPFMGPDQDFMREVVEKCHANGIKVIARFDFSKTDESFLADHPDWYTRTIDNEVIQYNGIVATCINSDYQQKYSLEILREVLDNYAVDGIFFNAFGYFTVDFFTKQYVGICQCVNCKRRFQEAYGEPLPTREDEKTTAMAHYQTFKQMGSVQMLDRIHDLVKSYNPNIAICTYHHHKIDIIRHESNSAVDRPQPFWLYASSESVATIEGSYDDKVAANCVINAVDFHSRFMGVSKYLNQIRLIEDMASGSGLDYCINGPFETYPDKENFEMAQDVFRFHKRYEQYYGQFESLARILIVVQQSWEAKDKSEFLGFFKLFKEEHRLFRVVSLESLEDHAGTFDQYDLIILPGTTHLPSAAVLSALEKTSATVLASGNALANDAEALRRLFGIELGPKPDKVRGSYVLTEPKSIFKSFPQKDWVYLDGDFRLMTPDTENTSLLPMMSAALYAPAERSYGNKVTDQFCVTLHPKASGQNVYYPWQPASIYYKDGFEAFKDLVLNLIDHLHPATNPLQTNAPACVEIFFDRCGESRYILQLLNLSGFNGTTIRQPLPVRDITVNLALPADPKQVSELGADGLIAVLAGREIKIGQLDTYKAFIIDL